MRKPVLTLLMTVVAAVPALTLAQAGHKPNSYAGQEKRAIKALDEGDVQNYLNGRGMGLAKPGELNGYPGPMHVLQSADDLRLTASQKAKTQTLYSQMHVEAVRLGRQIVEQEAKLDRLFASRQVSQASLQITVAEIARLQGQLRVTHLRAHVAMKSVLTPAQVKKYNEVRGYTSG